MWCGVPHGGEERAEAKVELEHRQDPFRPGLANKHAWRSSWRIEVNHFRTPHQVPSSMDPRQDANVPGTNRVLEAVGTDRPAGTEVYQLQSLILCLVLPRPAIQRAPTVIPARSACAVVPCRRGCRIHPFSTLARPRHRANVSRRVPRRATQHALVVPSISSLRVRCSRFRSPAFRPWLGLH